MKQSVNDVVFVGKKLKEREICKMSNSLFGKFLGKAPPLEVVLRSLLEMWRGMGSFTVSDMSNGFFLIRCDNPEMVESVLW